MTAHHHFPRHSWERTGRHHSDLREHGGARVHQTHRDRSELSISNADVGHQHHGAGCAEFVRTRFLSCHDREQRGATGNATLAEKIEKLARHEDACVAEFAGGIEPQMFEQTAS